MRTACFSRRTISCSAFWCPVAVLGCAAMISWTRAARSVPRHPCDSGSSGMSWCMYFRRRTHFLTQRFPSAVGGSSPPTGLSNVVAPLGGATPAPLGGATPPRKKTIAIIPKIPQ